MTLKNKTCKDYGRYCAKYSNLLAAVLSLSACGAATDVNQQSVDVTPSTQKTLITQTSQDTELTPMERGKILFKRCRACHTLGQDGRHKVGPNLWNIGGQNAASREGFNYSKALKAANIIWTEESLNAYIEKPQSFVPGTRMNFIGIKKPQDRADLLLYLKAQTSP